MIYIFCWLVNYFFMLLPDRFLKKKYGAGISLLLLGCVVVFRGRVGVDVGGTYEPMVEDLSNIQGIEPLFLALLHVLKPLFPTALLTVTMGLGTVFILLLFIYLIRADSNEVFIFQAFYIPAVFFDQSISGQRFGLAFVILMIMMQCVRLRQLKSAWLLSVIALFTHYSAAIFLVFWGSMIARTKRISHYILISIALIAFAVVAALAQAYFLFKYNLYFESGYERPSPYSGLSIVLITTIIAVGVAGRPLTALQRVKIIAVAFLGMAGFWIIGLYSYAALRLLNIVELAVPFAYLTLHGQQSIRFRKQFRVTLVLAGILGAGFIYKDMLAEKTVNPSTSPSLPYKFFWDENSN